MGEHLPKNLLNGPNQKRIPVNVDSWLNHSESIKACVHIVFLTKKKRCLCSREPWDEALVCREKKKTLHVGFDCQLLSALG